MFSVWYDRQIFAVGLVFLLCAVGTYAAFHLPVTLLPDIARPTLKLTTVWRNASPEEIESEILVPQENVLQGLPQLESMVSTAFYGVGEIALEFEVGTAMDKSLIDIQGRLARIKQFPKLADRPFIDTSSPSETLIFLFARLQEGHAGDINGYQNFLENTVAARINQLEGVSDCRIFIASHSELQIVLDPVRLARAGLALEDVKDQIGTLRDQSAGQLNLGARRFMLQFSGNASIDELKQLPLRNEQGVVYRLVDIADVRLDRSRRENFVIYNGQPAVGIRVGRSPGANVLDTLDKLKSLIVVLNRTIMAERGLVLEVSYDPSVFIKQSMSMLSQNLLLGVILAVFILWLFLREWRISALVAAMTPVCLCGTLAVLYALGRSLNIISLAGLGFAVGMVLDEAIILVESIYGYREQGLSDKDATLRSIREAWPALLASTLTIVVVFIPFAFLGNEEGQLFADLSIAITVAILFSFVVTVFVLPVLSGRLNLKISHAQAESTQNSWVDWVLRFVRDPVKRKLLVAVMILGPALLICMIFPAMEFLPPVKRDAVDTFFKFPSSTSLEAIESEIAVELVRRLKPYYEKKKEPTIKNYYIAIAPGFTSMAVRADDQSKLEDLMTLVRDEITADLPGIESFTLQGSLFGAFDSARVVSMDVTSDNHSLLVQISREAESSILQTIPESNVRFLPASLAREPALSVEPDYHEMIVSGVTKRELEDLITALDMGVYIGEYYDGASRADVMLKIAMPDSTESIHQLPVITPQQGLVPLGSIVHVKMKSAESEIRRVDGRRALSIQVTPPDGLALSETIEKLEKTMIPKLKQVLGVEGYVAFSGSSSSLQQALRHAAISFCVALFALFCILAIIFNSIADSLRVLLSLPIAILGGVLLLKAVNFWVPQSMDLLTMIGFIILIGLTVNNAILLVEKTRKFQSQGATLDFAVEQSLRTRVRPILITSLTTIFGMLPLLFIPGTGSEIYRGLAAVIIGGMLLSTALTMVLLPMLLMIDFRKLSGSIFYGRAVCQSEMGK